MIRKRIFMVLHLGLATLLFSTCANKNNAERQEEVKHHVEKKGTPIIKTVKDENFKYSIRVEKIDSLQFYAAMPKNNSKDTLVKITNIEEAKKRLKGIVEFGDEKGYEGAPPVKKIHFRNGQELKDSTRLDCYFIAYYPGEDILLCEGGHTTDLSFNLENGKETEETGNPEIISSSPKKEFRINGYFGGQECFAYFIQRRINDEYIKIIQLDEEFERLTKTWLCTIGETFWLDERTVYVTEKEFVENDLRSEYFRINIIGGE